MILHEWYYMSLNSLATLRFEWNFRWIIFEHILVIDGWGISWEIAFRQMSLDLADDKSTLVQVMAWCCQATSYYLSQCWPRTFVTIYRQLATMSRGISNHRFIDCLFSSLCRLRRKKPSSLHITDPLCGKPLMTCGSPHKEPVMQKAFPWHDFNMLYIKSPPSKRRPTIAAL